MPRDLVAWVTGARGFLGREVARGLHEAGYEVSAVGRGPWPDHKLWGVSNWAAADLERSTLDRLAGITGPPAMIFHAAGAGTVGAADRDERAAYRDTVGTTEQIVDFVSQRAQGCLIVYPSSCAVYGNAPRLPIAEEAPIAPVSNYGRHKAEAEAILQSGTGAGTIRAAIIRFFSLYGEGLRKQLLWELSNRVARGEREIELGGWGTETRDFLHSSDAVGFVVSLVEKAAPGPDCVIVNGGTGRALRIEEVIAIARAELPASFTVTFSGTVRRSDPPHYEADMSQANYLGLAPAIDPVAGLSSYCRWIASTLFDRTRRASP